VLNRLINLFRKEQLDAFEHLVNTTVIEGVSIYKLINYVEHKGLYNKNILNDIEFIGVILNSNHNEYLHDKGTYTVTSNNLPLWFTTDEGEFIHNIDLHVKMWCESFLELRRLYYLYTSDISYGKAYSNFKKLKTYIINTEYMITSLLKNIDNS